jgi:hypothetical protein
MAAFQIICISKTDRYNPHERIRQVGLANGQKLTVAQVIASIDQGNLYYVSRLGKVIGVVTAWHEENRYIKTIPDGIQPNNLLELPECL